MSDVRVLVLYVVLADCCNKSAEQYVGRCDYAMCCSRGAGLPLRLANRLYIRYSYGTGNCFMGVDKLVHMNPFFKTPLTLYEVGDAWVFMTHASL